MDNINTYDPGSMPKKQILSAQIDLTKFEKASDEEKRQQETLLKKSRTDGLTGLYNRGAYQDTIFQHKDEPIEDDFTLISFDLNGLKTVNDTLGHQAGDELIMGACQCMNQAFGTLGRLYRVGGDEFAAIIETELPREALVSLLERFLAEIADILPERTVSCSIGAWRFTFPEEVATLLTQTDHALYQAKENGRSCFVLLDETAPPPAAGDAR